MSAPALSPAPHKAAQALTWGSACRAVCEGRTVAREAWRSHEPFQHDVVLLHAGALHLRKTDGSLHTLIVSDGDIVANDWQVVE